MANLSPEEGFLLSRIDGATPWSMLRRIGGLPPEQVDRCVASWLDLGLLELDGWGERVHAPPPPVAAPAGGVDPKLDLPLDVQRRVIEFEADLGRPYHELLGVAADAEPRAVKRAYFKLSKVFHPDRYFGKRVGHFGPRLDRIFKRVALAYELLNDPATRAELQRMPQAAHPAESAERSAPPREFGKREWLAHLRKQFKIPQKVLAERRFRAGQLAEAARVAQHRGSWNEAASCIRLAIAFDPWSDAYEERFAEIQAEVHQLRAHTLLEEASGALDARSREEALSLFEEALHYRPSDPEIHVHAARVALELGELEKAAEYAERACELDTASGAAQLVWGRVLRKQGMLAKARVALTEAARLAPDDEQAQEELRRLRRRPGRSGGGSR